LFGRDESNYFPHVRRHCDRHDNPDDNLGQVLKRESSTKATCQGSGTMDQAFENWKQEEKLKLKCSF